MKRSQDVESFDGYSESPHLSSWKERIEERKAAGERTAEKESIEERKAGDAVGLDEKRSLDKPLRDFRRIQIADRREVKFLVARYRKKLRAELKTKRLEQGIRPVTGTRTLDRRIREHAISLYHLDNKAEVLRGPLRKLAPYINRFDWRDYFVVPKVRVQPDESSCWACVATETFESSLMIQRANSRLKDNGGNIDLDQVSVNVNSTLANVEKEKQGRHEPAFNYYVTEGVPLNEIHINDLKSRDGPLDVRADRRSSKIKAIAWDWVFAKSWRTPLDPKAIMVMKEALLDYGPLAVMVAIDDKFQNYGLADPTGAANPATEDDPVFATNDGKGVNHFVLVIGWDNDKCAWIIQNTFSNWGFRCRASNSGAGDAAGENMPADSEDRGFMYIGYGCNQIGVYAVWTEASLLPPREAV